MSKLRVAITTILLILSVPASGQDGSGGAQRTPESAQAFLSETLGSVSFTVSGDIRSGDNVTVGQSWPVALLGNYSPVARCRAVLNPSGPDTDSLDADNVDYLNSGGSWITSRAKLDQLNDGSIRFVEFRTSKVSTTSLEVIILAKDLQLDWSKVTGVSKLPIDHRGSKVQISRRGAPPIYIAVEPQLHDRVATAADFLKNACDTTSETGF